MRERRRAQPPATTQFPPPEQISSKSLTKAPQKRPKNLFGNGFRFPTSPFPLLLSKLLQQGLVLRGAVQRSRAIRLQSFAAPSGSRLLQMATPLPNTKFLDEIPFQFKSSMANCQDERHRKNLSTGLLTYPTGTPIPANLY